MKINVKHKTIEEIISRFSYEDCCSVFDSLYGVPYANIKGEALSLQAYKKTGQRKSSDIDILVSRKNINIVESVLEINGFENTNDSHIDRILLMTNSHQISPWIKHTPYGDVYVDVNFDLLWGEYKGIHIDVDDFLADVFTTKIYDCRVKILPPLKALIQLILHSYKDMNSIYKLTEDNAINYNTFRDVYYLLINNLDDIPLSELYEVSEKYKILPYVFYVLYYTNCIYKNSILDSYINNLRTIPGEALLDVYGLNEKERKVWKIDFKTRLCSNNLYEYIKNDLTDADIKKIEINKRLFG